MSNVTVIGIGAMGGGMARALLKSSTTKHVIGYDLNQEAVAQFHKESQAVGKTWSSSPPSNLKDAVIMNDGNIVDYVILVLVNEKQCDATCFSQDSGDCLLDILSEGSCVILSSTVTATWAKSASAKFKSRQIDFLDCPISGGPVRAAAGDLTLMASGPDLILEKARPLFASMGEAHLIDGGAGMGSTVKMVHQLLAGVHICAAAEALALAAKAGIDVDQMYKIVNSAAGASWMFQDRGQRMIAETEDVKSALAIHVKDLDIVYSEAKSLGSPIPLASSALQQFITGQILGYGRKDDSQVVKVYENATKVSVAKVNSATKDTDNSSDDDDDTNKMLQDGSEIVMVDDCDHKTIICNNYIQAFRMSLPPKGVLSAHFNDSLTFCLTEQGMDLVTNVQGSNSQIQNTMEFGQVCYELHESEQAQKISNRTDRQALYMTISILNKPPVVASAPLVADYHTLVPTGAPHCRIYKLSLDAGESVTVSYPFFYCAIVLETSSLKIERSGMDWEEVSKRGDVQWREPCLGLKQTNIGHSPYVVFIMECV